MAADSQALTSPLKRMIAGVIAPATVSTAVLYYFGWLRSQTIAQQFGYEASLLGFGPQDYILRSVQPISTLLIVGAAASWIAVLAHRTLARKLRDPNSRWRVPDRACIALVAAGSVSSLLALYWSWQGFDRATVILPALFLISAGALGYGSWLPGFNRPDLRGTSFKLNAEMTWVVTALAVAGGFVLTSIYARHTGRVQASENIESSRTAAWVTLTSSQPLGLDGAVEQVDGDLYVTTGLTFMFTAGGRHFLLPADYDPDTNAKVFTVPVDDVRLDFDNTWVAPCAGFEDLTVESQYTVGDTVTSAGVSYHVRPYRPDESNTRVTVAETDGDVHLHLENAILEPSSRFRLNAWLLLYRQLAEGVSVTVDGQTATASTFVGIAATDAGRISDVLTVRGGADGEIRLKGDGTGFTTIAVGGADLTLDCQTNVDG